MPITQEEPDSPILVSKDTELCPHGLKPEDCAICAKKKDESD